MRYGQDDLSHVLSLLPPHARFVAIFPEARVAYRQWPERCWQALLDRIAGGYPDIHVAWVGLDGGGYSLNHPRLINLLNKLSPTQIAALASVASAWVGSETGPTHIAAAVERRRTICIIGGGRYNVCFPTCAGDRAVTDRRCVNFPCGNWNTCQYGYKCVSSISVGAVWGQVLDVLGPALAPVKLRRRMGRRERRNRRK